jgi:hypothetical protein
MSDREERQAELDRNHRLVLQNNFLEQLKEILNDFWLLDSSEYTIIKGMLAKRIEELDDDHSQTPLADTSLRDFLVVMKEKVEYIITNSLCKRFPNAV